MNWIVDTRVKLLIGKIMKKFSSETKNLIDDLTQIFFVPLEIDEPKFSKTLQQLKAPYDEIANAFQHNLNSVVSMVSFPYALSSASAHNGSFARIHAAERIRALKIEDDTGETASELEDRRNKEALAIAHKRMEEFIQSDEGIDAITFDICKLLLNATTDEHLALAASDLILQGSALTWNAFEILSRDIFIAYLNDNPDAVNKLVNDQNLRKRFDLTKISIEDLAIHGFDLSSSMGSLLSKQQDLTDLPTIKTLYTTLFPPPNPFAEKLNEDGLWVLSQQRHLIVHQRGVVDERYKRNTKTNDGVGTRITISPSELDNHIELVFETGLALLEETCRKH